MSSKKKNRNEEIFQLSLSYDNPEEPELKVDEKHPILREQNLGNSYTEGTFAETDLDTDILSCGHDIAVLPKPKVRHLSHASAVALVLVEIIGLSSIAATVMKVINYHGGFSWDGGEGEFNFHSLFMVAGLIFCYANAALSSYVFGNKSETFVHYLHEIAVFATFVFTIFGMIAASQVKLNKTDFHIWLGVITLLLFGVQTIVGFIGLFPKCGYKTRKKYAKLQLWIALSVFILSITSCLLGFTKRLNSPAISNHGSSFMSVDLLTNIICMLLVGFCVLVTSVLIQPIYRQIQEDVS